MTFDKPLFIRWLSSFVLTIGLLSLSLHIFAEQPSTHKIAILIELKGGIRPATECFFTRSLKKATERQAAQVMILQLDTPGGLAILMRGIIKGILASPPVPVIAYVTPRGAHVAASSAGTCTLYATHIAAMVPGTNLGAATPIAIGTPEDRSAEQEKKDKKEAHQKSAAELKTISDVIDWPISAGLAQQRDRNVAWAEKEAVIEPESLSAEEALKINVINNNIVASDISSLLEQSNGMKVNVQGMVKKVNTKNLKIEKMNLIGIFDSWALSLEPSVAYIYAGLTFILLGLAFIIAEVFLPSFGMLGIGGAVTLLMGSILLMKTGGMGFGISMYLIAIIIATVTLAFFLFVLNLAFRAHRRPIVSGREAVMGKRGVVSASDDRLWVRIDGERWRCKSNVLVKDGDEVVVERLEGLICIVKHVGEK